MLVREWNFEEPPAAVKGMFDSFEEPVWFNIKAGDDTIRKFTIQVCKGYNGVWPKNNSGRY